MAKKTKKDSIKNHIFLWEGTDKKGNRVKGETRTASVALTKADLRRQGINPLKVRKKAAPLFGARKQKITAGDIAIFSRQLSTMMSAGVPIVQAFDIVGRGHNNFSMQEMVLAIKADIESGTTLTSALSKYPIHFDSLFCSLVEAGEHAGVLETLLDKIATYKEKTESLKGKIKKALTYPIAVMIIAFVITAVIMIFVVPQFKELFSGFGAELPAFTTIVINISDFVGEYWWAIVLGIMGSSMFISNLWKRSAKFKEIVDRILLKSPVIGVIMHKAALARFCRTTATMFTAGVPLVEALQSVSGATGSTVYQRAVLVMRDHVATGQSLQISMKQQPLFPHMVIQMVAIGEESGALDDMLSKVADFYEEEVDNAVDSLNSLLEPIIMVVLGTIVGGLVVSLYLPIFQLGSVVSGAG